MDWPVLVLVAIAVVLAGIGVWWWLQRKGLVSAEDAVDPAAREPVSIPVGRGDVPPVAMPVAPAAGVRAAPTTADGAAAKAQPMTVTPPGQGPDPRPIARGDDPPPGQGPDPRPIARGDDPAHPFGPASAAPGPDGSGPDGWTIKGNADSGLYHTPSSPSWRRMHAEAWFESEEAAEAAGFRRWDWRRASP